MRVVEEEVVLNASKQVEAIVTFDQRELMVILFEAMMGVTRPDDATVEQALADIEARLDPMMLDGLRRQAEAVMGYVQQQMRSAVMQERLQ